MFYCISFVKLIGVTDRTHHQDVIFMRDAMDKITGKNSTKNRQKRNFFPPKRYRWNPDAIPYMLDKSLGEYYKSQVLVKEKKAMNFTFKI